MAGNHERDVQAHVSSLLEQKVESLKRSEEKRREFNNDKTTNIHSDTNKLECIKDERKSTNGVNFILDPETGESREKEATSNDEDNAQDSEMDVFNSFDEEEKEEIKNEQDDIFVGQEMDGKERKKYKYQKACCPICGNVFANIYKVKIHMARVHQMKNGCPKCGLQIQDSRMLKEHVKLNGCNAAFEPGDQHSAELSADIMQDEFNEENGPYAPLDVELDEEYLIEQYSRGEADHQPEEESYDYALGHLVEPVLSRDSDEIKKYKYKYERKECKECGKSLSNIYKLKQHMKTHTKHYDYRCEICTNGYRDKYKLIRHMQNEHPHIFRNREIEEISEYLKLNKNAKCWICKKKMADLGIDLKAHIKSGHTYIATSVCPVPGCQHVFPHHIFLEIHLQSVHNARPANQSIEIKKSIISPSRGHTIIPSKAKLEVKEDIGHNVKCEPEDDVIALNDTKKDSHACDFCGLVLGDIYRLKIHLKKHVGEGLACSICRKQFPDIISLAEHTKSHNPFLSSQSPEKDTNLIKFSTVSKLPTIPPQRKTYSCDKCNIKFPTEYILKQHQLNHVRISPGKGHNCEFCKKSFLKVASLIEHKSMCSFRLGEQNSIGPSMPATPAAAALDRFSNVQDDFEDGFDDAEQIVDSSMALKREQSPIKDVKVKEERLSPVRSPRGFQGQPVDSAYLGGLSQGVSVGQGPLGGQGSFGSREQSFTGGVVGSSSEEYTNTPDNAKVPPEFSSNPFMVSEIQTTNVNKGVKVKGVRGNEKGNTVLSCAACNITFNSQHEMELHRTDHIKTASPPGGASIEFPCAICSKGFSDRYKLFKHMQVEHMSTSENSYQGKGTVAAANKAAQRLGTDCEVCGEGFERSKDLKDHYLSVHNLKRKEEGFVQADREFECDICFRVLADAYKLKRHRAIHTGEYNFACQLCDRKFYAKDQLERHMAIHSAREQNDILLREAGYRPVGHARVGGKVGAYKCDICGRGLSDEWKLKRHRARHTGDLPFSCPVCCKKFFDNYGMTKHMEAVHPQVEIERPVSKKPVKITNFQCDICEQYFADGYKLKRHRANHTGDLPYQCLVCPRKFFANYQLNKHMLTHHTAATAVEDPMDDIIIKEELEDYEEM